MKLIPATVILLMLTACSDMPSLTGNPGLYTIPVGSVLRLNQPLNIPAGKARTGIQYGQATLGVDKWDPYCELVVNTVAKTRTTVPAGDFKVTRIRRAQIPYADTGHDGGHLVASADDAFAWLAQGSPSYSWLYKTTLRLESPTSPDVRQLECGAVFGTGYEARDITIKEFQEAVGDVMMLPVAAEKK